MAGLGELALVALALNAASDSSAKGSTPPPKDTDPPPKGGPGLDPGVQKGLELAGTIGGTLLTTFLGGGGGAGAGAGGAGVTGGTIGTVGAGGGGAVTATTASTAASIASVTAVTAGGVFCLAWAALYVLQFVIIDALEQQRMGWLTFRHKVQELKRPFLWLQEFERLLVDKTLDQLGLAADYRPVNWSETAGRHADSWAEEPPGSGAWNDPRLTITGPTGGELRQMPNWRVRCGNPFQGRYADAAVAWRHLQMSARLVASRYVFELAKFSGRMLSGVPGLGGVQASGAMLNPPHEVWAYPLLGGGQPDKDYPGYKAEVLAIQAAAPAGAFPFTIDDVLNSAKLTAFLHASSHISRDPEVRPFYSAAQYGTAFYMAMVNGDPSLHMGHYAAPWEHTIFIDPVFYKVPVRTMWLDVHMLKGGFTCAPFQNSAPGLPLQPTPHNLTALAVSP